MASAAKSSTTPYLAQAVSIEAFVENVVVRMKVSLVVGEAGAGVPGARWVAYQFVPRDPTWNSSWR